MAFTVSIVNTTDTPILEGDPFDVTVEVTNTGDSSDTQQVTLSVDGSEYDSTDVAIENGQSKTVTLVWETGNGDAGTHEAVVASTTDQDTTDVTVEQESDDATFQISTLEVLDGDGTTIEGEELCISCTVENVGSGPGARWVGVGVGNDSLPADKKKIHLDHELGDGDHELTATLFANAGEYREGNDAKYEKKVWGQIASDDSELERGVSPSAETTTQVTKLPHFVTTVQNTNAPVEEGQDLEVTATVENNGGEAGPVTVTLAAKAYNNTISNVSIISPGGGGSQTGLKSQTLTQGVLGGIAPGGGGTVVDDTGVSLQPGESEQVTLQWNTDPGNAGKHVLSVQSISTEKDQVKRGMVAAIPPWERDDWDGPVFATDSCLPGNPIDDTLVSVTQGPMRTGRFEVQIDDVQVNGWQSVTIPGKSVEQAVFGEGGDDSDEGPWGQPSFDDLEMERGVKPGDTKLHDWFEDVRAGSADSARKEISITLLDENGESLVEWQLQKAWIKNYDPPELDANADGDIATESATIAYDKMVRKEV